MINTLDEAIAHERKVAEELKNIGFDINTRFNTDTIKGRECYERAKDHEQLADLLEELKARREADRWIPVSERLPEKGNTSYLVTVDYGNGNICSCQRFFFNAEIGWNDDCVTAWRPLPKYYTESEGN